MKRYIKLLTCTVFGVCGLLAFSIYQHSIEPVQPVLALETLEGDPAQIEDLSLNGQVSFYEPSYIDSYSYTDGETALGSDESFFNRLDSHSIDNTIDLLRRDYPNFMRNKGLITTKITETNTHILTANFVGDFDPSSQSDEMLIGLLDKDTGEDEAFTFYPESTSNNADRRIVKLYEALPEIHLILQIESRTANTIDYEQVHITYNVESFSFTEESIDFSEFNSTFYAFGYHHYANEPLIVFERPIEGEDLLEFPLFYNFETQEILDFPTPEGERNVDYIVEIFDNDAYLFIVEENSIDISRANQSTEEWDNLQTIATTHTPISAETTEIFGYRRLDWITFEVEENTLTTAFLTSSRGEIYDGFYNDRIQFQVNDLETGEQTFLGEASFENTDAYDYYELYLPEINLFEN